MKKILALVVVVGALTSLSAHADYDRTPYRFLHKTNETLVPTPPPQMSYIQGEYKSKIAETSRVYAVFSTTAPTVGSSIASLEVFSSAPVVQNIFRLPVNLTRASVLIQRAGYSLYFIGDTNGNGVLDLGEQVEVIDLTTGK